MKEPEVNGVGPAWFPKSWRESLTRFSLNYFDEQAWIKHDVEYTKGGFIQDKLKADKEFYKDLNHSLKNKSITKKMVGYPLASAYYASVTLFGFSAYNFIYIK